MRFQKETVRAVIAQELKNRRFEYEKLAGKPWDDMNGTAQIPVMEPGNKCIVKSVLDQFNALQFVAGQITLLLRLRRDLDL